MIYTFYESWHRMLYGGIVFTGVIHSHHDAWLPCLRCVKAHRSPAISSRTGGEGNEAGCGWIRVHKCCQHEIPIYSRLPICRMHLMLPLMHFLNRVTLVWSIPDLRVFFFLLMICSSSLELPSLDVVSSTMGTCLNLCSTLWCTVEVLERGVLMPGPPSSHLGSCWTSERSAHLLPYPDPAPFVKDSISSSSCYPCGWPCLVKDQKVPHYPRTPLLSPQVLLKGSRCLGSFISFLHCFIEQCQLPYWF